MRLERQRGVQVHLEGSQVAVVDAQQRGAQLQGTVHLGAVVHLDQYRHIQVVGDGLKLSHLGVIQTGRDQQNSIRAHSTRFEYLIGVHHKVFAQNRQVARRTRLL